jgi:hypothetical protein
MGGKWWSNQRQLHLPVNRRLQQSADFLDQSCGQQAACALLVAQQAFAQLGAAELVDIGVVARVALAAHIALQHVALATGQGAQLAHAAQIARDAVVDLFGAETAQLRVVEQADARRLAHVHLNQPVVDDKVAGHVPQKRLAPAPARQMAQGDVQNFVGDDETQLQLGQARAGVDVDGAQHFVDGGDGNVLALADAGVLDDVKRRDHAAQQRKAVHEPVACAVQRAAGRAALAKLAAHACRHFHGLGDGASQARGKHFGPVAVPAPIRLRLAGG